MRKEELSEVRRQLRCYYDMLLARERELAIEKPVFKEVFDPLSMVLWGTPYYFVVDSYEFRGPLALRDAVRFCELELQEWSTMSGNDKRLNDDQHSSDLEED